MNDKKVMLIDSLTNCATDCVSSFENSGIAEHSKGQIYGQGIVNGMVAVIMSNNGRNFKEALEFVKRQSEKVNGCMGEFDINCVPKAWREDWEKIQ